MKNITESPSKYRDLEQMPIAEILQNINREDQLVAQAVQKVLPQIEALVEKIVEKMKTAGRLFYIGAGTSGRLGVLDASECPPTFGVSEEWVIGLIAGGDIALRKGIEFAEDDRTLAWQDLSKFQINDKDVVVGIAASGTTPYVIHGLKKCQAQNITTACITCNEATPLAAVSDFPIEVIVGAEFLTGSTRMKAGTAQKMILNMISTSTMIRLGRVQDNRMIDMQLSNDKLLDRGAKMLMNALDLDYEKAMNLLLKEGSVRKAMLVKKS